MTVRGMPMCAGCEWLDRRSEALKNRWHCRAYPDGIPTSILWSLVDHRLPWAGDQGIQYMVADDATTDRAVQLFGDTPVPADPKQVAAELAAEGASDAPVLTPKPDDAKTDDNGLAFVIEVGHGTEYVFGHIAITTDGQVLYRGASAQYEQTLHNIVDAMGKPGQAQADIVRELPKRLRNYLWAKEVTGDVATAPAPVATSQG
jgi:hypothetical protein